jgi:hypothetical protein
MIDTIKIEIPCKEYSADKLYKYRTIVDDQTGVINYYQGRLKNLDVKIKPVNLGHFRIFVNGSIKKYYYGQCSLNDLTFRDFHIALGNLRSDLEIPFWEFIQSRLLRLDCGFTFQTSHPVREYIQAIHSHTRMKSKVNFSDTGVQFSGANKKIIFYDKYKELQKHCPTGQIKYNDEPVSSIHWLRFEIQFRKISALRYQLRNIEYLTQISDHFPHLLSLTLANLEKIQYSLRREISIDEPLTTINEILAAALIMHGNQGGDPLSTLDELLAQHAISRTGYNAAITKINQVGAQLSSDEMTIKEELFEEVRRKIYETYLWYYSSVQQQPREVNSLSSVQSQVLTTDNAEIQEADPFGFELVDSEGNIPIPEPLPEPSPDAEDIFE